MVPGPQVSKGNQILIRFVSDEYFPSDPGFCIRYTLLHQVRNDSYTTFFLMLMQHLLRAGYVFVENNLLIPNDPVLNYISTWLTLNTQCAQDSVLWEIQCTLFNRNRRDMLTWKKTGQKNEKDLGSKNHTSILLQCICCCNHHPFPLKWPGNLKWHLLSWKFQVLIIFLPQRPSPQCFTLCGGENHSGACYGVFHLGHGSVSSL